MDQFSPLTPSSVCAPAARLRIALIGATLAVLGLFVGSFTVGTYPIASGTVVAVFLHRLHLVEKTWSDAVELVILNIRGPRIAAALLVGAALATAGAAYQHLFRNPLVSPAVLGVSAGAGFGAALGVLLSLTGLGIQGLAFLCGLTAVALAFGLAQWLNRHSMVVMVLAGLVISAFFQALISVLKVLADPLNHLPTITFWLLGGLNRVTASDLLLVLWPITAAWLVLYALRWEVHVLAMGDEDARSLGINVPRVRLLLVLAATLMTATAVSISGIIGWVGLLIPHIVRMLVGPNFHAVLPMCAVVGGGYLLAVDTLCRAISTSEMPLGILTALLGAPFFTFVLARTRQAWF
jgi:iron complex transport system permease protein